MGMYEKALALAPFLIFWFLRKMVLDACVLIVEPLTILPFAIVFLCLGYMICLMSLVVLLFLPRLICEVVTTK
jgi:hypothetical protein